MHPGDAPVHGENRPAACARSADPAIRPASLKVLHQPQRVVDGGVDVAAGYGVADAEEGVAVAEAGEGWLGAGGGERVLVGEAVVERAGLQLVVELVGRDGAVLDDDVVGAVLARG